MRTSVTSLTKKFISTFFAATLALGLVPAAAFADISGDSTIDEEVTQDVISSEADEVGVDEKSALIEQNEAEGLTTSWAEDETVDSATGSEDIVIPAANERINETMALQTRTVAQAESTRNYFLAQTLESTRTVPIVSANLPLDISSDNEASQEEESDDGEDDSEADDSDPRVISTEASDSERSGEISPASTVVGSFTYNGITYAVEPGGETVAVVAADYNQLSADYIENQIIVVPSMTTADGMDYYTVSRIADYAFSGITLAVASENSEAANAARIDMASDKSDAYEDDVTTESSEGDDAAEQETAGIIAIGIPASVTSIGDNAFAGCDTLQYVIVSEDNPIYSHYDGALYDADQTCLLLIPEV